MIERLGAHRFRRAANAAETNAIDALEAAMDAMRNGEICPLAITVVVLDEHGGIKHFSAGDVSVTTRVGMMEVVKSLFTSIAVEP